MAAKELAAASLLSPLPIWPFFCRPSLSPAQTPGQDLLQSANYLCRDDLCREQCEHLLSLDQQQQSTLHRSCTLTSACNGTAVRNNKNNNCTRTCDVRGPWVAPVYTLSPVHCLTLCGRRHRSRLPERMTARLVLRRTTRACHRHRSPCRPRTPRRLLLVGEWGRRHRSEKPYLETKEG